MNPMQRPPAPQRSGYSQSMDGVANVLAIIATFFLAPMLFQISVDWVRDFAADQYGSQFTSLASLLHAIICAATVYWVVRGLLTEFLLKRGINNLIR